MFDVNVTPELKHKSKYKCHSAAYLWPGELAAVEHDDFEG